MQVCLSVDFGSKIFRAIVCIIVLRCQDATRFPFNSLAFFRSPLQVLVSGQVVAAHALLAHDFDKVASAKQTTQQLRDDLEAKGLLEAFDSFTADQFRAWGKNKFSSGVFAAPKSEERRAGQKDDYHKFYKEVGVVARVERGRATVSVEDWQPLVDGDVRGRCCR